MKRLKDQQFTCRNCGTIFFRKFKANYCSAKCSYEGRRNGIAEKLYQSFWFVRWGTKYEEDDCAALIGDRLSEEFARALHRTGWAIVDLNDPTNKWPMDPQYGPVPEWADDMSTWQVQSGKAQEATAPEAPKVVQLPTG